MVVKVEASGRLKRPQGLIWIIDDSARGSDPFRIQSRSKRDCPDRLELLVSDGRIHPARIEEIVLEKVEQEIDTSIREAGEQATFDAVFYGMHPELIKLIGRAQISDGLPRMSISTLWKVAFLCGSWLQNSGPNSQCETAKKRAFSLHWKGRRS